MVTIREYGNFLVRFLVEEPQLMADLGACIEIKHSSLVFPVMVAGNGEKKGSRNGSVVLLVSRLPSDLGFFEKFARKTL